MTMMAAAESNVCVHHHHLFGVSLPMELTLHVLSFLEPPHLLQLGLCSRFCHALANDDSCAFALLGQLPPWALPHLLLLLLLPPPAALDRLWRQLYLKEWFQEEGRGGPYEHWWTRRTLPKGAKGLASWQQLFRLRLQTERHHFPSPCSDGGLGTATTTTTTTTATTRPHRTSHHYYWQWANSLRTKLPKMTPVLLPYHPPPPPPPAAAPDLERVGRG